MRALVAPNGTITEAWHYDRWGNPISPPAQRIEQPFLWNGAYDWTYTPFTGLYHLNPEYDPRTGRYLQRQGSNPTNPYITADNDPLNNLDENTSWLTGVRRDASGRGRQMAQQLKAAGQFVAELHPGVLATAAAYGRDCYGEQLSVGERIGAAVGAIGGWIGSGVRRVSTIAQRGIRAVRIAYEVWKLRRAGLTIVDKGTVILRFDPRQLQRKFKHASDFGVVSKWSREAGTKFEAALRQHCADEATIVIRGTYRGTQSVYHYYNIDKKLLVMFDLQGNFISGWRLSEKQIENLLQHGNVQ